MKWGGGYPPGTRVSGSTHERPYNGGFPKSSEFRVAMLRKNLPLAVIAFCFTLITGCSGGGSPSNTPVTAPALSVSTLSAFSAASGSTSAPQTLTLTNTGTATLTISGTPVLGGTNPTAFAMTATTCGSSLAPNASCTVTLTFTAPGVGSYRATVTISGTVV